jgi:hypothetical protein
MERMGGKEGKEKELLVSINNLYFSQELTTEGA